MQARANPAAPLSCHQPITAIFWNLAPNCASTRYARAWACNVHRSRPLSGPIKMSASPSRTPSMDFACTFPLRPYRHQVTRQTVLAGTTRMNECCTLAILSMTRKARILAPRHGGGRSRHLYCFRTKGICMTGGGA